MGALPRLIQETSAEFSPRRKESKSKVIVTVTPGSGGGWVTAYFFRCHLGGLGVLARAMMVFRPPYHFLGTPSVQL
jgi:hypothetical protein